MIRYLRTLCCAVVALSVSLSTAAADDDDEDKAEISETRMAFEAEIEIGIETVLRSDDSNAALRDIFAAAEIGLEYALSDRTFVFAEFSFDSVLDAETDRAFDDLGFYVGEVGIRVAADPVTLSFGKISPPFGSAWETAPGYFGAEFAEDYELEEMLGVIGGIELGRGTLLASVFYADNTRLSDGWGTSRGRNSVSDGGAGNTGKLNNVALQYDLEIGETTLHAGARHLSRGIGDVRDEQGIAFGFTQDFGNGIVAMAEAARFSGWEGSADRANLATVGASLVRGPWQLSLAHSRRRIGDAPVDRLTALGVDYEFRTGATLSTGLIIMKEEEVTSEAFGISLTFPIGE